MFFGLVTLATALIISGIAAYYSIIGLTAIFAAAVLPIVLMGGSLEIGKVVTAVWLHRNWNKSALWMRTYLTFATVVLMFITSMGIFGFLSKAHIDQTVTAGDNTAIIARLDTSIEREQKRIVTADKQLRILDDAIERYNELGAVSKGVKVRADQKAEREAIAVDVKSAEATIARLEDEKLVLTKQQLSIEAEVGPIKYIAEFIYGQDANKSLLEEAVRWVIIVLVLVFDPLAIILILAGTQQIQWAREQKKEQERIEEEQEINAFLEQAAQEQFDEIEKSEEQPVAQPVNDPHPAGWMYKPHHPDTHPYLRKGFVQPEGWPTVGPIVGQPESVEVEAEAENKENKDDKASFNDGAADSADQMDPQIEAEQVLIQPEPEPVAKPVFSNFKRFAYPDEEDENELVQENTTHKVTTEEKAITHEPSGTEAVGPSEEDTADTQELGREVDPLAEAVKNFTMKSAPAGKVLQTSPLFKEESTTGFGSVFPIVNLNKGDIFLRTDYLPSRLFKWNGEKWIEISKENTSHYAYDVKYIEHLISKLKSGEYELEDLSETEQDQIEQYLLKNV